MSNQTGFLNDLLDDLTPRQLTELLNYMAVRNQVCNRANIKFWRMLYAHPEKDVTNALLCPGQQRW